MCNPNKINIETSLDKYREEIDLIDSQIINLFEQRIEVAVKVAEYKKENKMNILQGKREEEVIKKALSELKNMEYSEYAKELMNLLMNISKEVQKDKIK
ncbi:chorismate mutase [Peptacetobacter hominis]|uniref:Chorismate mutase n=1 Tax=Peptacetobacter hominis TaxID=2743610 RepID=A0A544QVR4_9FIRM|nr:chorismate mutase [Peptacetobacter hominis]TQQ84773.1 chorismate mutase [Peptacetobacter hominis]